MPTGNIPEAPELEPPWNRMLVPNGVRSRGVPLDMVTIRERVTL